MRKGEGKARIPLDFVWTVVPEADLSQQLVNSFKIQNLSFSLPLAWRAVSSRQTKVVGKSKQA